VDLAFREWLDKNSLWWRMQRAVDLRDLPPLPLDGSEDC
jgi:hypothetical protein